MMPDIKITMFEKDEYLMSQKREMIIDIIIKRPIKR
jgi:hypothetical protein